MKTAAVVIWYHPSQDFVKNILTYYKYVHKIIIVDNSPFDNSHLLQKYPSFEYIALKENKGIAAALNIGLQRSIDLRMDWALTMDQDSWFDENEAQRFLNPSAKHFEEYNVAIFAPSLEPNQSNDIVDIATANTSGSLTNLSIFETTTGFDENLFIDEVDHDYNYRIVRAGHRILRLNGVFLNHTLGNPISKRFLGRIISSSNHNAIRKYYIARNLLYVSKKYPEFNIRKIGPISRMLFRVIFIEEKERLAKLFHVLKGVRDYRSGKMGKK